MTAIYKWSLSASDCRAFAVALRDSGAIFDYRALVAPRRLLRRYPTGALSEKVALVLPAVIAALASDLPIATNFLVARTLGFTGGTFDKLASIPDFTFPQPGHDTEELLRDHNVAMCVTSADVAPADRFLYQIRSITGTVESPALVVASIASKQGALPCHRLILDVRYGEGAFLQDLTSASAVAEAIQSLLVSWGIPTDLSYLEASWPTGSAVGNAVEVAEAVELMRGISSTMFPNAPLRSQWDIVMTFLRLAITAEFGATAADNAVVRANALRLDGTLLQSFSRLLAAHGVSPDVNRRLLSNPMDFYYGDLPRQRVLSELEGTVTSLDQRTLGNLVNFSMGAGGNDFGGHLDYRAGVVLSVAQGDKVSAGDVLCTAFSGDQRGHPDTLLRAVADCFRIDPS